MQALDLAERDAILEVFERLALATSKDGFLECMKGPLQRLIPHESFICGLARLDQDSLLPKYLLAHSFPEQYLDHIRRQGRLRPRTLRRWSRSGIPLAINFLEPNLTWPAAMFDHARLFKFKNLLCHGQFDIDRRHMSYVSFHRIEGRVEASHCDIAKYIMPHLHASLLRLSHSAPPLNQPNTIRSSCGTEQVQLSQRQLEILYLLGMGKTNWEIGLIVETSIDNVKYHVKQIGRILNACNRSDIVATAGQFNLLPLEWPGARRIEVRSR
jgi:LuxR family transcriptional regulator, quorum-sensing system regulator CviR